MSIAGEWVRRQVCNRPKSPTGHTKGLARGVPARDSCGEPAHTFETHLDLLAEAIQQQKTWARDFPHLWIGVAATQLYDEERQPLVALRALAANGVAGAEARTALDRVRAPLTGR